MLKRSSSSDKHKVKESELYTLKTLQTPSAGHTLAKWLMGFFVLFVVCLFLPWQQNVKGKGKVTAMNPANRPQTVESAIAGRIKDWRVSEGMFVERGDTILVLAEVNDKYWDPNMLQRLEEQIEAKKNAIEAKRQKAEALRAQIAALKEGMNVKSRQATNKLNQARLKLESDSVDYEAEKVRFANIQNQYERNKTLYNAGNIALSRLQELESKLQEGKAKVVAAQNKYLQSKTELVNTRIDITGVVAENNDKIKKAESELNATLSDVYDSERELSKLLNDNSNMQIRSSQYHLLAPQDGYVLKVLKAGIGETIKEGEAVASIVPQAADPAVELYVKAMDVPLIAPGRLVRIEFDGWPALQFSGWPAASVGSFGGIVRVVDRVNSSAGEFRILVTPDPEDEPWPELIRIGSGAKGWIMLDDVPLGYEIWRQLNGFPPNLYEIESKDTVRYGTK